MILTPDDIRLLQAYKIAIPEDVLIDDRAEQTHRDEFAARLMADIRRVTEDER